MRCRWAGLDLVARVRGDDGHDRRAGWHADRALAETLRGAVGRLPLLPARLARNAQTVWQVLSELLRDLRDPFPALWAHFHGAHPDREAARLLAKVLGQMEAHGLAHVAAVVDAALRTGTPVLLALMPAPVSAALETGAVPPALRDIDVRGGCAADYDGWLTEVTA